MFYKLTSITLQKLRAAKLTAADWRIWSYFVELDPWGDSYQSYELLEVMDVCRVSKATFYRALAKLQKLELFDFQCMVTTARNLHGNRESKNETGVSKMRLESQKRESQSQKRDASYIYRGSEDQTFSERERETKAEQLKSDPEVNNQESCQPQTNNFPNPAQQSVNSGEKFSAAAAAVFEIPAEKKRGFYDALRQYAANTGVSRPSAYAKVTMSNLEQTGMCSLWDDFEAGLELGTSDRPSHEWLDPETGKPYPFLVRAVEEIAKAKSNDSVAAATEAAKIINNPKLCQPVWASVKRELLRYSKEAERMQRLGVQHTYLPPRYSDKPLEPALSEVKDAIASITPGRHVETRHGASLLEKSEATPTTAVKNREKSETLPDPWKQNPLEVIELQERKAEEALDKARNEAQRQLRASQMKEVLEQIKATLPTDPQERQSQLQIWMNDQHPYPAIAKRLIEANQNWGLYLDGTRVLEEEF